MVELLKAFGRGILYVILFPFFVLGLVLFAVIGLFAFVFHLLKCVIYFFTGQKFFPELPEDRELRLKREAAEAAANPVRPDPEPTYQPNPEPQPKAVVKEQYVANDFVEETKEEIEMTQPSIEAAVFQQEPEEEETPIETLGEDSLFGFLDEEKEEKKEPTPEVVETKVEEPEEEELEEYRPKGSSFISQDDDDDNDDNGLHIGFDN